MSFRVIQWATGGVGRAAMEGVLAHPDLELAGAWVHSPAKDGRRPRHAAGPRPDRRDRHQRRRRAPRHRRRLRPLQPDLRRPDGGDRHPRVGQERGHPARLVLPAAPTSARSSTPSPRPPGVTLHGTGIHPGGITERFPLMISALSGSITHVRAEEFSDIRTYGAPDVVRDWMLFGKTPGGGPREHHGRRPRRRLPPVGVHGRRRAGLRHRARSCAPPTRWRSPPRPSTRPIGPIQPGTVAAQRFTWEALVDGEPVVTAAVNWLMGEEHLDPAWTFGPRASASRSRSPATRAASPPSRSCTPRPVAAGLVRNPGIVATAMHCVNAIPYVCRGRARPAHLPRPAAGGRPRRAGPAPGPAAPPAGPA